MKSEREKPKQFQAWLNDKPCRVPHGLMWFEWQCERLSYRLGRWAFLEVLEYVGKLGILVAAIAYIVPGCHERKQAAESAKQAAVEARKSRQYVAWQTINSAVGKPGDAGRANALQDLSKDGVRMDGISLSGHVVLLGPLNLSNAKMARADFSDAEIEKVNLADAELMMSRWDNTKSIYCDFRGASFWTVAFKNTTFSFCDFGNSGEGKNQRPAVFLVTMESDQKSSFMMCNFASAELPLGIWNSVSFAWCNFANAHFGHPAIGTNVSMEYCNLFGATASSPDFIKWAYHQPVVFTNVTTLDGWHCSVTNKLDYKAGSPEFIRWASNQFNTYVVTNNPQAWLDWSRDNLK